MADIAISVAGKIAEYLVDPITLTFRYMWNYKSYLENLENEVKNLDGTRNSVQHSVEDARRKGEEIESHGFSCPNLKNRYQLSKKAARKLKDVVGHKQTATEFKQA
ncbi:hypothetical protein ACOSQ4_014809 [Xanthoceras sorbifolium]